MSDRKKPAPLDLQILVVVLMGATALHGAAVIGWFEFILPTGAFRIQWGFTYSGGELLLLRDLRMLYFGVGYLSVLGLCAVLANCSRLAWLFVGAELIAPVVWLGYYLLEKRAAPTDERGVRACAYIGCFCGTLTFLHAVRAWALARLVKRGLHFHVVKGASRSPDPTPREAGDGEPAA
jgi:hypothetical protein